MTNSSLFPLNRRPSHRLLLFVSIGIYGALVTEVKAGLFQHLDASVGGSVVNNAGTLTWLDQSGNARNAVDTSAGSGSVSLSTDSSVFPTGLGSIRFEGDNFANYGRLQLFDSATSDAVLNQSGPNPSGFSVFVVVRGDTNPATGGWNDLIGNTTDVLDGSFLMRYNYDNGRFQGALGGLTVQNNGSEENNYNNGAPTVLAFNYDPSQASGEITLASSLNDYSQVFNLSNAVTNRDFSNNDPFTLGKAQDTITRLFVGNVGELKIYDESLTAGAFAQQVDDLHQKWNATADGRIDLIVDRATGQVTLNSPGSLDIDLVGLRLRSPSGSLDTSDWLSITDNYDADSGAALDGDNAWLKLSEKGTDVSEATFGTTTISPGQTVNLGNLLVLGGADDLEAEYADPITQAGKPVLVRYVNQAPAGLLPGDYNDDGAVDAADYSVWRDSLGASVLLPNEVVSIGRVSSEDYAVWRAGFGSTDAPAAAMASAPEPGG